MKEKILIKGMSEKELRFFCESNSFPSFHGEQIFRWIYQKKCDEFAQMKNIPQELLDYLNEIADLFTLNIKSKIESKVDKTIKYLLETSDGNFIETVSMYDKDRHTVCLSSQIGCSVDCDFCATGKMGIIRNLNAGEIIDQLIIIQKETLKPITNIVFMGMGEPFLNYSNVIKACNIFSNSKAFNLGKKRITISTSGILPKIKLFIKEKHKFKLAISLNAPNNDLRDQVIPINKRWNIESILSAVKEYRFKDTSPIMFEYTLLKKFNDEKIHATELANLLKGFKCKINLIPFNEIEGPYLRPEIKRIEIFSNTLQEYNPNLRILVRWSKGEDIKAACGQLATSYED